MVYSSSFIWSNYIFKTPYHFVIMQSIFIIMGFFIMKFISNIDYNAYKNSSNKILILCVLLLILVLIPGVGKVRNGSRSWFGLGGFGLQPSELAKIGLIIFVSKYLSKNERDMPSFKKGVLPILLVIGFIFFLIMLEPDFGTGMIITMTALTMVFISKANFSFVYKLSIVGIVLIGILILMAPYRLERILSFLNPWKDPLGSGFQIIQSLYAIGPNGLLGAGFLNSVQKNFYLPEPETDFIFSIISEEFGFLGVLIVTSFFLYIFYISMKIFFKTSDLFGKYLVFGLSFGIILQAILNLSVVVGLIPVTGVTLPFISYGGSSLISSFLSIGIILNVEKNEKKQKNLE